MRYGEQIFEIDVSLDGLDWNAPISSTPSRSFHRRHEELYTYASRDQEVVFVNARVAAVGERRSAAGHEGRSAGAVTSSRRERARPGSAAGANTRLRLDALAARPLAEGPAIIEAETTTVVVDTGDRVSVNGWGWLDIVLR